MRSLGHTEFPKHQRTLLPCSRKVTVEEKCGGTYKYFGIKNSLPSSTIIEGELFKLLVNIDGLPLTKSTKRQFWPILGKVGAGEVFVICLYHGTSKPDNMDDYLADFLKEVLELYANGIEVGGTVYPFSIFAFVLDRLHGLQ